jgi:three-Cys-motif partner protein
VEAVTTTDAKETAQKFGGPWSLIKTDMVRKYVNFFNSALKGQSFEKVYIDAFAGSGAFSFEKEKRQSDLFTDRASETHVHPGSAQIALEANPPFNEIFLIEKDPRNVEALNALVRKSGHAATVVELGDANSVLRRLCEPDRWKSRRGVIFLDPFGMSVDWNTLALIAHTRALDVWFLFSLAGIARNLPRRESRLDAVKHAAVTRVLGTEEWYEEFYGDQDDTHPSFISATRRDRRRTANIDQIEEFFSKRLRTIFSHVEPPKRLKAPGNKPLFSMFFAVSNRSVAAIELAKKGAAHILKKA